MVTLFLLSIDSVVWSMQQRFTSSPGTQKDWWAEFDSLLSPLDETGVESSFILKNQSPCVFSVLEPCGQHVDLM